MLGLARNVRCRATKVAVDAAEPVVALQPRERRHAVLRNEERVLCLFWVFLGGHLSRADKSRVQNTW